ncbi:MAG: carotenoid biosynthesis protein [Candidatus Rokubacteria bacterium]|nr:carotenoid biosynthesis protein [Candidatus Rokubacteria bacterium]
MSRLVLGSLLLRPYVFALLALYLAAAVAEWGWRRAAAFTLLASGLAFVAEFSSTRIGLPFGLYRYTGVTQGHELYLANVPFFDPLSFAFLAYASLGLARLVLRRWRETRRVPLIVASGLLMLGLDLVIDPLAVRGDRWFLGRIFYYPEPGRYFGVPIANFVGWAVLGALIAGIWLAVGTRFGGGPPRWARYLPGRPYHAVLLYYLVLAFNLVITAAVAESALFWAGVALHLPLAVIVVSCVASLSLPSPGVPSTAGSLPDEVGTAAADRRG